MIIKNQIPKQGPFFGVEKRAPKIVDFCRRSRSSENESRSDEVFVIFVTMRSMALRVEAQRQLFWESRSDTSSVPQGFERFSSRVRSTISKIAQSACVGKR